MCRQLADLRQSIVTYGKGFDANALTPSQAAEVVRVCAQIEASAASIKALAAARSAEGTGWQLDGYRAPSEQLAHDSGMSPAAAKRALEAGRRLTEQPDVASAALAGELSLEQAAAVSAGVAANPTKARDLIDKARRSSLPELNEEVARIRAEATDQEARHRRQHERRSLRRWTDLEGALQSHLTGVAEDGARVWRMLDPIRRRLNLLRRHAGMPVERLDALDYDALMVMADIAIGKDGELTFNDLRDLGLFPQLANAAPVPDAIPSLLPSCPPPATKSKKLAGSPIRIMVRVDLPTLLRGFPIEGELCEIAGYGPVAVSVIEDLLATDNPFIVGLLTKYEELLGVYHHGRHPNAHQRSALDFLSPICTVEGCSARAALQYDHREDYAKTQITGFDLLDRLCTHHHRLKTNHGWALVDGGGKRAFVPPHDPRHPRVSAGGVKSGPSPPDCRP